MDGPRRRVGRTGGELVAVNSGFMWGGFQPRIGTVRIIATRWLALGLASLIPAILTRSAVSEKLGASPYVKPDEMLSAIERFYAFKDGAMFAGAVVAAVVLFVLFDQLVTSSALRIVDPYTAPQPVRLWRALWRDGFEYLPAFLRIVLLAGIVGGLGVAGLGWVFEKVGFAVQRSYPTALVQYVWVGALQSLLVGLWLTGLGVWGLWCRVFLVADRRRVVRRAAWMALKMFWRTPVALVGPVVVIVIVQAAGAPLLAWSWLPGPGALRGILWFVYLGVQVVCWYGVLHGMRRLYDRRKYDDLRILPDAGFRLPSRLVARLRRK